MRRIVATFDETDEVSEAMQALREAGLAPEEPDIDNSFFDPTAEIPEERGLIWGGLLGGMIGAVLLFGLNQHVFWVPRISPIMTAGLYELVVLGFGLGVAGGGFLGGVIGTYRRVPEQDQPRVAVLAPDHRVEEATELVRAHGARTVDSTVTHHEHPQRAQTDASTD